jgi:hypothetical protein
MASNAMVYLEDYFKFCALKNYEAESAYPILNQ